MLSVKIPEDMDQPIVKNVVISTVKNRNDMAKLTTTDAYRATFHILNGAECGLNWLEPRSCTFTLTGENIDEVDARYYQPDNNVNARKFIAAYKELAARMKATKPV